MRKDWPVNKPKPAELIQDAEIDCEQRSATSADVWLPTSLSRTTPSCSQAYWTAIKWRLTGRLWNYSSGSRPSPGSTSASWAITLSATNSTPSTSKPSWLGSICSKTMGLDLLDQFRGFGLTTPIRARVILRLFRLLFLIRQLLEL
jgi:hypothetical protein